MNFEELLPEWLDVTPEQFDYCVRNAPWTALKYCAAKLTEEQKNIVRRMLYDR